MRSIVLCEGIDDAYILGYYLFKTIGWTRNPNVKFSSLYDLPQAKDRSESIEVYVKQDDLLTIWSVGGKDSFDRVYQFISSVNKTHPNEGIQQLFIVTDRDKDQIDTCLQRIRESLKTHDIHIDSLSNRIPSVFSYEDEGDQYELRIVPVIIPFDQEGALETILLNGLSEQGPEDSYIVKNGIDYVDTLVSSGNLKKYLQHERLVIKAKFSAALAIITPDRSTATFNKILMGHKWEMHQSIQENFSPLNESL